MLKNLIPIVFLVTAPSIVSFSAGVGDKTFPLQDSALPTAVHGKSCTNFSGKWVGTCTPTDHTPYQNHLKIRQNGCSELVMETKHVPIYPQRGEVPSDVKTLIGYWNDDQSVLNLIMPFPKNSRNKKAAPTKYLTVKRADEKLVTEMSWSGGSSKCIQIQDIQGT